MKDDNVEGFPIAGGIGRWLRANSLFCPGFFWEKARLPAVLLVIFTVSACGTDQTTFRPPTAATTTPPTTTTTTTLAYQISIWDTGSGGADLIQLNSDERAVAADLSIMTTGANQYQIAQRWKKLCRLFPLTHRFPTQ